MTVFWVAIAAITAVALLTIWLPFLRRRKALSAATDAQLRQQTNLNLYKERLAELERDQQDGRVDAQEFEELKQEMQLNLLQNNEQEDDVLAAKKPSALWPSAMSLALVLISGFIYYDLGHSQDWQMAQVGGDDPHAGMSAEQLMSVQLAQMEQAVEQEPENSQAWFNLGHAYMSASQYDNAMMAFDRVMELVGVHAELLGPKATAMYYKAGQQMTPEIEQLVEQALADDKHDPSTRLLLGMNAFFSANYEDAIANWEMILASSRPDVDRQAILGAIAQARAQLQQADEDVATVDPTKQIRVEVRLDEKLQTEANQDNVLYVFARPVEGPAMPLAIAQLKVADLPTQITLDDSNAMSSAMTISQHEQVELIATININGSPKPTPGDMIGRLNPVNVGSDVTVVIDTLVE